MEGARQSTKYHLRHLIYPFAYEFPELGRRAPQTSHLSAFQVYEPPDAYAVCEHYCTMVELSFACPASPSSVLMSPAEGPYQSVLGWGKARFSIMLCLSPFRFWTITISFNSDRCSNQQCFSYAGSPLKSVLKIRTD